MEVLLSLEAVVSDSNWRALRHLYDTVESQIRGLNSMGVKSETYGALLSSVMLGKLPQEIRLFLSRGMGDGDRNLDDMMKLLLGELQARERAAASNLASGKGDNKPYCRSLAFWRPESHTHLLLLSAIPFFPCLYESCVHWWEEAHYQKRWELFLVPT